MVVAIKSVEVKKGEGLKKGCTDLDYATMVLAVKHNLNNYAQRLSADVIVHRSHAPHGGCYQKLRS